MALDVLGTYARIGSGYPRAMSDLTVLIELQSVHDNLATIHRDLTTYPTDLAALDTQLKDLARKREEVAKGLATARTLQGTLATELDGAQKAEELAKASLRVTTQKIQYTAAIRELDERQRQRQAAARPLKEAEARIQALEGQDGELQGRQAEVQKQFDELKAIFLAEHENQVVARGRLEARAQELEAALPAPLLARFKRLLPVRQGRAVARVENGACTGCRTRLRTPVLASLRDGGLVFCDSCQRILFDPARP